MSTTMLTDAEIQQDVLDELDWDPEIKVTDVGVEVDDGVVTLTGTVKSFHEKMVAEDAAFRVTGVRAVANDIVVRPSGLGLRTDTDIAHAVAVTLEWNPSVPHERLHVAVSDGNVTLEGDVDWNYQRERAAELAKRIIGVRTLANRITVRQPKVSEIDVQERIEQAFVRSAELESDRIRVELDDGHVTLSGRVRTWAERREAEDAAWRAPGITGVTNELEIKAL